MAKLKNAKIYYGLHLFPEWPSTMIPPIRNLTES